MVSEERVHEIAKALKCTPRQCRQHLLAAAGSSDVSAERAIELIRGPRPNGGERHAEK
jgi:hypothetical protein